MPVPNVIINVQDFGLLQSLAGAGNLEYVIGVASTGPYYQPITSTNPADFVTQNGYGPGVELAAFVASSTGNPVCFTAVPPNGGSNTAVTGTIPGGSTSVMSISGTPNDTYYGRVTVINGGTTGTAGIQIAISLDNGRTTYTTQNLLTATTYAIPNTGLTISFTSAATLVAGDYFSWLSTEPTWSQAAVSSAIQALYPLPSIVPEDIIVAGGSSARNGAGTVGVQSGDVTVLDGYMTALFNKRRYNRLLCGAGDALWGGASTETEAAWMTSLEGDFAASSSLRVSVSAGHYNAISPLSQTQFRRSLLWQAAARDSAVAIQVDLGRVRDGVLANTPIPTNPDGFIYHDESVRPGLDAARFLSAYSLPGKGFPFIANPNIMAPPGSDFNWLQHGHVMDAACLLAFQYFVNELSDSVRVSASTGFILPQDADAIQNGMNAILSAQLVFPNACSAATCLVNRTNNILTTAQLIVTISIVPLGYIKSVNVTLTFVNPAVQAVTTQQPGP